MFIIRNPICRALVDIHYVYFRNGCEHKIVIKTQIVRKCLVEHKIRHLQSVQLKVEPAHITVLHGARRRRPLCSAQSRESDFNAGSRAVKQKTISFRTATDDGSLSAVPRSALKFK